MVSNASSTRLELDRTCLTISCVLYLDLRLGSTDLTKIVFAFYETEKEGLTNDHLVYEECCPNQTCTATNVGIWLDIMARKLSCLRSSNIRRIKRVCYPREFCCLFFPLILTNATNLVFHLALLPLLVWTSASKTSPCGAMHPGKGAGIPWV